MNHPSSGKIRVVGLHRGMVLFQANTVRYCTGERVEHIQHLLDDDEERAAVGLPKKVQVPHAA